MNQESRPQEDWTVCEPGALEGFARRAKQKRRFQDLSRSAAVAGLLVLVVGIGLWSLGSATDSPDHRFGGISCHEVQENIEAYAMGTLPDEMARRIRVHVQQCPHCGRLMEQMSSGDRMASIPAAGLDKMLAYRGP